MYLGEEQIMARNQTASQTIVVVAMGLVAGACAVALHQHAGLPGPVAATAALSGYLLLLTIHAFAWRRTRGGLEPARSRGIQVATQRRPAGAAAQTPHANKAPPSIPMPHPGAQARGPQPPGRSTPAQQPSYPSPQGQRPGPPSLPPIPAPETKARAPLPPLPSAPRQIDRTQIDRTMPPPLPNSSHAGNGSHQASSLATGPVFPAGPVLPAGPPPARPPAGPAAADDLQDLWSFRPASSGQKLPPFVTGRVSGASGEPRLPDPAMPQHAAPQHAASQHAAPTRTPQPGAPRQADVEVIQDAIKRLLEEVNAAERTQVQANGAGPPPLPPQHAPTGSSPEGSIERSIEALRMTAGTMRSALGAEASAAVPPPQQPAPPQPYGQPHAGGMNPKPPRPMSPADARARLMADAISAGRIDVALEPILGLEDQQTRHYEVSVRLRDADGNPLEVSPDGPDLRGTGLLPLFDGVRVTRTAAVARRLEDRGKGGSVFSAFSGESVADEHFLGELAETLHLRGSLASQLVLTFTQTDVRGFSTPEWDSLADMRALGFRFALSHMTDLDMDFEALAEQGFVFAKLDASVFLSGLPAPSGHIPSPDVCRHLAGHGLTLVVERIDDEEQLARVFGFGVLLGQGQHFGGARPVRAEVANDRTRGGSTVAA